MTTTTETLIAQLGTALPMMGAHSLVDTGAGLQFGIRGSQHGNKIRITLRPDDLYDVELWRVRGADLRKMGMSEGIYADQLHAALRFLTGLDTRI